MLVLIISLFALIILCIILARKILLQEIEIFDLKVNIQEKNKLLEWQDELLEELDSN